MARKLIDLTGMRFGSWRVIQRYGTYESSNHTVPTWLCVCDCGSVSIVPGNNLRSGVSTGCMKCRTDRMLGGLRESRIERKMEKKEAIVHGVPVH